MCIILFIYLIIINVIMSVCMFTKNFWTRHCQTLKFCTCVHAISRISTKAGFYFSPTGSDVIGQWRHRANWEKFRQRWSYHTLLERKLNADSDSHNKHGLKMKPSRDIMVYCYVTLWSSRQGISRWRIRVGGWNLPWMMSEGRTISQDIHRCKGSISLATVDHR